MKSRRDLESSAYNLEQLHEEWRNLTYRIAFTEFAQHEADLLMAQIAADEANGNTQEEDAHFMQAEAKTLQVIRNAIRKRNLKKFARQTLPKAGKIAASILLIFFIGLSVAIASVHSVRIRVLELLINIEDEYTELSLQENPGLSFDIPPEWGGSYYPSEMPRDFTVSQVTSTVQDHTVILSLESDKTAQIIFSEMGEDVYTNLDTEDSVLSSRMVKGSPALVAVKGDKISVAWAMDSTYFILICRSLQENEVLAVADSVVRIK